MQIISREWSRAWKLPAKITLLDTQIVISMMSVYLSLINYTQNRLLLTNDVAIKEL